MPDKDMVRNMVVQPPEAVEAVGRGLTPSEGPVGRVQTDIDISGRATLTCLHRDSRTGRGRT